jgi:cell division protein FtsZ
VISNDKLRHQFGNLTMKAAFSKADNVLATAAKCITDVINSTGQINVDFADVCTVMRNGGVAILGSAACEGENRAQQAIEDALNSPLLNDNDIRGAKWILININSAEGETEFTMDEVETIQNHLLSQAGENTDVILGLGYDSNLGSKIGITLIATGFEHKVKQPIVEIPVDNRKTTVEKSEPEIIHFELSSTTETPTPAETPLTGTAELPKHENQNLNKETVQVNAPTSGGYLAKPSNLYVEEPQQSQNESKKPVEEPLPLQMSAQVDEPAIEMQLVVKDSLEATEEPEQTVQQAQPIMMSNVEEQAMPDETDELKRKALDRIAKLRNLSFNINAADPNNEFESVPAYLRRNMELHNSIADVESFYSNYTVKSNQNNQAEISTINSFLEGKKPD